MKHVGLIKIYFRKMINPALTAITQIHRIFFFEVEKLFRIKKL